jgi:hypothetical protein
MKVFQGASIHSVRPVVSEYLPLGQSEQTVAPVAVRYFPLGQAVQAVGGVPWASAPSYFPAAQSVHLLALAALIPPTQLRQRVIPVMGVKVPTAQVKQLDIVLLPSVGPYFPTGQPKHPELTVPYLPRTQLSQ